MKMHCIPLLQIFLPHFRCVIPELIPSFLADYFSDCSVNPINQHMKLPEYQAATYPKRVSHVCSFCTEYLTMLFLKSNLI